MPKRNKKPSSDPNVSAFRAVAALTEQESPVIPEAVRRYMSELGKRGGRIGGAKRRKLPKAERERLASLGGKQKAANARARAKAQS